MKECNAAEGEIWRRIQRTNFTRLDDLTAFLDLSEEQKSRLHKNPAFILNLPRRLAEKAEKRNLDDPIVRQFLPLAEESIKTPLFVSDPVADAAFRKTDRMLQKYAGRSLIISTGACAMHCRFCFRQNFPYEMPNKQFDQEITWLKNAPAIREVILSGGDPLSLSDANLSHLINELAAIPHITKIRFHTRFPIGIPERVTERFLSLLDNGKQVVFIIHSNHVKEFDDDIWQALQQVRKTGALVLNQSTLLKGVNDSALALSALSEALVDHGIVPYYLHQLDRVQGAAHFEVPESKGLEIVSQLQASLPGYAVPKYVREIPHAPSKTAVSA